MGIISRTQYSQKLNASNEYENNYINNISCINDIYFRLMLDYLKS